MIELLLGLGASLLLLWIAMLVILKISSRGSSQLSIKEALFLLPETIKLFWRLARDRQTPKKVRIGLLVVFLYLISPLDIIPDFIPVLGVADEIIVIGIGLRFVVRHAGASSLDKHWKGTDSGLVALKTLAGVAA